MEVVFLLKNRYSTLELSSDKDLSISFIRISGSLLSELWFLLLLINCDLSSDYLVDWSSFSKRRYFSILSGFAAPLIYSLTLDLDCESICLSCREFTFINSGSKSLLEAVFVLLD